jgi:hypothetical protein
MTTPDNNFFKDKAYMCVYDNIQQHHLYDKKFFSNYDEFKEFCEKDLSSKSQLFKLTMYEYIKLKKVVSDSICEYYLTHNSETGELNKPITYFKYTYRRK